MGQYWIPVNLDKKEFIDPHKLASGLKLWEQLANHPGTGAALIMLCAAMPERRGGGDFKPDRVIGRWAGDRIALVGDYAEDSDLAPEHRASTLYDRCRPETEKATADAPVEGTFGYWNLEGQYEYHKEIAPPEFTDVTELVAKAIENELQGKYKGEGWKDFVYDGEEKAAPKGLRPDMVITTNTEG